MTTPTASIRPYASPDEEHLLAIIRASDPNRPPPVPGYLDHMLAALSGDQVAVDVAELGGNVAGFAAAVRYIDAADPGAYTLEIVVDPARRGQGAGQALCDRAMSVLLDWHAKRIYAWVREDGGPGRGFAERRGFEATGHVTRSSRLNISTANVARSQAAATRVAAEGIKVVTLQETDSDVVQDAYRATIEAVKDQPSSEKPGDVSFDMWQAIFLNSPGTGPDQFWVALDGDQVVGVAPLMLSGGGAATNAFTGVVRSYRGRGVARALKLATIQWSRDNGIDYIYTGNDSDNKPMLAINLDLGYEPLPPSIELVKKM